jgi:hypothetical protein
MSPAPTKIVPMRCRYPPNERQADLTMLSWNRDGTLLAVASYDSIIRVIDHHGDLYFSSTQHKVSMYPQQSAGSREGFLIKVLNTPESRVPFSQSPFINPIIDC